MKKKSSCSFRFLLKFAPSYKHWNTYVYLLPST